MVWDEHVRMGAVVVHKQHLLSVTLVEIVVPATQIRSIPQRLRISCKRGLAYDLSQVSEGPRALNEQTAHLAHLTVELSDARSFRRQTKTLYPEFRHFRDLTEATRAIAPTIC